MEKILIDKLRSYLVTNAPDVIVGLNRNLSLTRYLEDRVAAVMPLATQLIEEGRPQYIIEELCMNELTKELRPSRFLYIQRILEEEFASHFRRFRELGVLTYETINLIEACQDVFEELGFSEDNEDDRHLRYAVVGAVADYLKTT